MSLWEVLKCSCPKPCLPQNIHAQAQPWMFLAVALPHIHFTSPNAQGSFHLVGICLTCLLPPLQQHSAMPPHLSLGRSLAMSTWMFPTPSRWAIPETVYILKQLESLENFQQRNVVWSDLYFKGSWISKRLLRLRLGIIAFSDSRPGCCILRLFSCLCIIYLWPDLLCTRTVAICHTVCAPPLSWFVDNFDSSLGK